MLVQNVAEIIRFLNFGKLFFYGYLLSRYSGLRSFFIPGYGIGPLSALQADE
jgi:hypothetical protein